MKVLLGKGALGLALALGLGLVSLLGCASTNSPPAHQQPTSPAPITSEADLADPLADAPDPFAEPSDPFADAPDPFAEPSDPGGPLADAPNPFAEPSDPGDPLAGAPDPFAEGGSSAAPLESASPADLSALDFSAADVDPRGDPPGFEIHGRANLTGAITRSGESVELLEDDSLELSSLDLYVEYYPTHWFGVLAEGELDSELDERERVVEPELELLIAELRPLGDTRIRLRLGHAPVPFGLERRYYAPPRNELANRPAAFRRVFPGTYSDVGGVLWIDWPLGLGGARFELEAGLTKGLDGPTRDDKPQVFAKDKNASPQFSGRVALTLFEVRPTPGNSVAVDARLTLGASLLAGQYDDDARRRIRFYGLDAELILGGFRARAELVRSTIERQTTGVSSQDGIGVYVLVAYHWYPKVFLIEELFLAARYGRADPDEDVREATDVETYHVGAGWSPYAGVLTKAGFQIGYGPRATERVFFLELGYSF